MDHGGIVQQATWTSAEGSGGKSRNTVSFRDCLVSRQFFHCVGLGLEVILLVLVLSDLF